MNNLFNLREPYRTYGVLAVMLLSLYAGWFSPSIAHADYSIDTGGGNSDGAPFGHPSFTQAAQTFLTTSSDSVHSVEFKNKYDSGTFGGTITVAIYDTAGGSPTGSALATVTGITGNSSCGSYTTATFASDLAVSNAHMYAVVFSASVDDATNFLRLCSTAGSTYGPGGMWYNNSGWVDDGPEDAATIIHFVTAGGGGGGGGGGTGTTSTSTISYIDNPNENLFNGFVIFFMSWFGVMWILRRRQ